MNSIRIKGMSVALIFKKINDLSVTNSMEENYQKPGENVALRAIQGKIMNLHSKTEDGALKYENQQKNSKDREK